VRHDACRWSLESCAGPPGPVDGAGVRGRGRVLDGVRWGKRSDFPKKTQAAGSILSPFTPHTTLTNEKRFCTFSPEVVLLL
jgi:hypothetical protein